MLQTMKDIQEKNKEFLLVAIPKKIKSVERELEYLGSMNNKPASLLKIIEDYKILKLELECMLKTVEKL